MAKEMIVSVNGREKKIAIIEDDVVTEFYVERGDENQGIVGNIYKGRVMKVLPGMQSAFVDIGLDRDSFLYVSDFLEDEEFDGVFAEDKKEPVSRGRQPRQERSERPERGRPLRQPVIAEIPEADEEAEREAELHAAALSHIEEISEEPVIEPMDEPLPEELPGEAEVMGENPESEAPSPQQRRRQRLRYQEEAASELSPLTAASDLVAVTDDAEETVGAASKTEEEETGRGRGRTRRGSSRRRRPEEVPVAAEKTEVRETIFLEPEPVVVVHHEPMERIVDEESEGDLLKDALVQERISESLRAEEFRTTILELEPTPEAFVGSLRSGIQAGDFERISDGDEIYAKAAHSGGKPAEADDSPLEDASAELRQSPPREDFATRRGGRGRRYRQRSNGGETPSDSESGNAPAGNREPREPRESRESREPVSEEAPADASAGARTNGRHHRPVISELLREGQEILVQIAKEPIGQKGARITSHIALPGRYIVYMPTVDHIGVSRKISPDEERQRLRRTLHQLRSDDTIPGGFIVRTAASGRTTEELRDDVQYLFRTWTEMRRKSDKMKAPTIIHRDLDLVQRILRDQLSSDYTAIRVDNEFEYERIVDFVNRFAPKLVRRVKLYTKETPILEEYGVQAEVDKAVKPRVWLKSGGYIVINQTEALVAIDVNTGKFVGRSNRLEDTIVKTNLEAAREMARQIRLRDLGGIIVLDFIDMEERRNRIKVMQALEQELRHDKSPSKVLQFNDFGLVAITRKRVKQSLERTLCTPCVYCGGSGMVKSAQTVCYEILAEARRVSRQNDDYNEAILRVGSDVAKALRAAEKDVLQEIEAYLGVVTIKSDPTVHQEQFDIALV
jgi:ribonuclease G